MCMIHDMFQKTVNFQNREQYLNHFPLFAQHILNNRNTKTTEKSCLKCNYFFAFKRNETKSPGSQIVIQSVKNYIIIQIHSNIKRKPQTCKEYTKESGNIYLSP